MLSTKVNLMVKDEQNRDPGLDTAIDQQESMLMVIDCLFVCLLISRPWLIS